MKIYTKTGDRGETGLLGGVRVRKDHPRIEAYGTVDELNAALGVTRASGLAPTIDAVLEKVQHELFAIGAELASPKPQASPGVNDQSIAALERAIDDAETQLPPLRQFVLPGGGRAAAHLHLARTICRRAERLVVALAENTGEHVSTSTIIYLNRLSDLLFVLARLANLLENVPDVPWDQRRD